MPLKLFGRRGARCPPPENQGRYPLCRTAQLNQRGVLPLASLISMHFVLLISTHLFGWRGARCPPKTRGDIPYVEPGNSIKGGVLPLASLISMHFSKDILCRFERASERLGSAHCPCLSYLRTKEYFFDSEIPNQSWHYLSEIKTGCN